jgi:hypothetical protein
MYGFHFLKRVLYIVQSSTALHFYLLRVQIYFQGQDICFASHNKAFVFLCISQTFNTSNAILIEVLDHNNYILRHMQIFLYDGLVPERFHMYYRSSSSVVMVDVEVKLHSPFTT